MAAITINSNIAALNAERQLGKSTSGLRDAFSRLSSGLRINKASDDAAGLAISSSLNADKRVFDQGVKNLNDGRSALSIADGALEQLSTIAVRLTELAEQAANGTMKQAQRKAIDSEAQALKAEFKRISQTTSFNGLSLFSGSLGEVKLQTGFGAQAAVQSSLGGAVGTTQLQNVFTSTNGLSQLVAVRTADLNGDGFLDMVGAGNSGGSGFLGVAYGDGQGGFSSPANVLFQGSITGVNAIELGDLNSDGVLDILSASNTGLVKVFFGNANGTFAAPTSITAVAASQLQGAAIADVNNDGNMDIAASGLTSGGADEAYVYILLGNGNGTFGASKSFNNTNIGDDNALGVSFVDFNRDGVLDMFTAGNTSGANGGFVSVRLGTGGGNFGANSVYTTHSTSLADGNVGDLNGDGLADIVAVGSDPGATTVVLFGRGNGTFGSALTLSNVSAANIVDLNGDGNNDLVGSTQIVLGNGNGTFVSPINISLFAGTNDLAFGDINTDGVLDVLTAGTSNGRLSSYVQQTTSGLTPLLDFSLSTQAGARQALPMFKQKLDQLAQQRGKIGAFEARIASALSNTQSMSLNVASAASQITNADVAEESASLVKQQILQKVGTAILAQANQLPELALTLLNGA